jgi:hypothetical protein
MNRFEQTGSTLPAADAHGHDTVAHFPARHFIGERSDHPRTGHAKRMTMEMDPPLTFNFPRIYSQAVAAVDHLHRKSLVQFPEARYHPSPGRCA